MKIACFADLHVSEKNLPSFRLAWEEATKALAERGVRVVAIAGDVFDNGTEISHAGACFQALKCQMRSDTNYFILPGNHDFKGPKIYDGLYGFDGMPNVKIMRGSLEVEYCGDVRIIALPWRWDRCDAEHFVPPKAGRPTLFLAHLRVIGAKMGNILYDDKPGEWRVSREWLENLPVDHIALGDFHRRQTLVEGKGGYVGCLRQTNYGESGYPTGFEIWDSDTNETEWVSVDSAPRYWVVRHFADGKKEEPPAGSIREQDHVRVFFEEGALDDEQVRQMETAGAEVFRTVDRPERENRAEVPDGILDNTRGLIELWAANQTPVVEGARLERMLKLYESATK